MELERQLSSKMDRQEAIEVCESLRDYLYNARSTPNAELYRRLDLRTRTKRQKRKQAIRTKVRLRNICFHIFVLIWKLKTAKMKKPRF